MPPPDARRPRDGAAERPADGSVPRAQADGIAAGRGLASGSESSGGTGPAGGTGVSPPTGQPDGGRPPGSPQDEAATLELLTSGSLDVKGRLVDASNATLYCTISGNGVEAACVYKPVAGERPLWDFPDGTLAGREIAAYLVSRAGGWDVVPPTVHRDGPFGPGMCQLWIETDETVDLVELARSSDDARLRQMAVFDAVVNNADRKIGHLLPVPGGHLYGCDHGVCFGTEYKLRTVLWQWRGRKLRPAAVAALRRVHGLLTDGELAAELRRWLTAAEVAATISRTEQLLEHNAHPYPPADWPAVPWPPV